MKRVLSMLVIVGVLCLAPAAQAGVSLKRYDCDTSKGVSSFVKDYLATNASLIIKLVVAVLPDFSFDNENAAFSVSESSFGLNDLKGVLELAKTKTSVGFSPMGAVNTALHLVCFEMEMD